MSRVPRALVALLVTPGPRARARAVRATRPLPVAGRRALGALLCAAGLGLLVLPLTTLRVAWVAAALALVAAGVGAVRRGAVGRGVAALVAGGAVVLAGPVLAQLPHLVAGLWALWCAFDALLVARRGALVRTATVVAGCSGVMLASRWPDLGTLALAWASALLLARTGVAVARGDALGAGPDLDRARWLDAGPVRGGVGQGPRPRADSDLVRPTRRETARGLVGGVLVLTVTAGAWVLDVRLAPVAPEPGAFYTPPDLVPAEPGSLVRSERYDGVLPDGVDGWRVLYTTRLGDGTPAVASALVALPRTEGPRTLVAWQHGTTGVDARCAPSLTADALTAAHVPGVDRALARGWGVVATDYPGQGVDGPFPYLLGEGQGRAVLDAVSAAQELDASPAGPVLLWGHSQGGHATLWAGALADGGDLDVRGVAALSAAADPAAMAAHTTRDGVTGLASLVVAYVLDSYAARYDDVVVANVVDAAGAPFLEAAASRCTSDPGSLVTVAASLATTLDRPLYTVDGDVVRRRLAENAASGDVGVPLLLAQGDADSVVPVTVQRSLAGAVCSTGAPVTVREYAGWSHLDVVEPRSPLVEDLLVWSDEVLAGGSPRDCG